MTCFRSLLLVAFIGAVVSLPTWVEARSCPWPEPVRWGFLGLSDNEGSSKIDEAVEAPRNVAVVHNPEIYDVSSYPGTLVPVVPHAVQGLWRPETPPAPGTLLESPINRTVVTTDAIDTEPPSSIELSSISTGGPCGMLDVSVDVWSSDDHTPRERLVYAVYGGATYEEAMQSTSRIALYRYIGYIDRPGPHWLSISVLDQAGNESPRSEPLEVIDANSGCAASGPSNSPLHALILLLFVLLARRHRTA